MTEQPEKQAALVDDNLMFSAMVEGPLRRLGYRVKTLAGSAAAVEALAELAPELVLVNLTSGRYPAPDLIRAIRAHPRLGRVAIVGYAGHVERHFLQAGREAGADMVVPNSAVRSALPEVLAKLQRRRAGQDDPEWPEDD